MIGIILAAGLGTRLRPLTENVPKPLIQLKGKAIVEYCVEKMRDFGVKDIYVNAFHLADQIVSYFKGRDIEVVVEHDLLGTAGAIKNILEKYKIMGDFVVMNGDTITEVNLTKMVVFHESSGKIATVFTNDTLTHNGGTFMFKPLVYKYLPNGFYSLHQQLLLDLEKVNQVTLYKTNDYYYDIGTPEKLNKVNFLLTRQLIKCPTCEKRDRKVILGEMLPDGTLSIMRYHGKDGYTKIVGNDFSVICHFCSEKVFIRSNHVNRN